MAGRGVPLGPVNFAVRSGSNAVYTSDNRGGGRRLTLAAPIVAVTGSLETPAAPVELFVETTGSDANAGRTRREAVATVPRAMRLAQPYPSATLRVGAGSFDLGTATLASAGTVSVLGTDAIDVEEVVTETPLVGGSRTVHTVLSSSAPLTPGALVGKFLRAGTTAYVPIVDNTATTITVVGVSAGGTFAVVSPGTTLTWPSVLSPAGSAARMYVQSVVLQFPPVGVLFLAGTTRWNGVVVQAAEVPLVTSLVVDGGANLQTTGVLLTGVTLSAGPAALMEVRSTSWVTALGFGARGANVWSMQASEVTTGSGATFELDGYATLDQVSFLQNTPVLVASGDAFFTDVVVTATSAPAVQLRGGATLELSGSATSLTGTAGVNVANGSRLLVDGTVAVAATTGGAAAVRVEEQSHLVHSAGALTVTAPGGVGLQVATRSSWTVGAGATFTVTDAATDVALTEGSDAVVSSGATITPSAGDTVALGAVATTLSALTAAAGTLTDDASAGATSHRVFFRHTA